MQKNENKRLMEIFFELIKVGSPTGNVKEIQNLLNKFFIKHDFDGGLDGKDNLVFRSKKFDARKSLLLTTHVDTVSPGENIKPKVKDDFVITDGTTILGADPKSGIAAIMFLVEKMFKKNKEFCNLELIFSTNEEEGEHTLAHANVKSRRAIVLDNAAEIDKVLYKSPFAKVFEIFVEGREVYAQINYNKGANAITSLAKIIDSMDWGFYKKGCVANTGTITGGRATTLVAKKAYLKGNVYCFEENDVNVFLEKLQISCERADKFFKTNTKIEVIEEYKAAVADTKGELISKLRGIYKKNEIEMELEKRLLISSNNCLAEKNIESVNVGLGYYGCHTIEEKLSISQFEKFAEILEDILFDFKLLK